MLSSKRNHSSTSSALETSTTEYPVVKVQKKKKKKRTKNPESQGQLNVMDKYIQQSSNGGPGSAADKTTITLDGINKQLADISQQLSNVITKDDRSFLREIIKETVNGMKEEIVQTVKKHIEKLESDIFDQSVEIGSLRKEIKVRDDKIQALDDRNQSLTNTIRRQEYKHEEQINELEQYSRRNNIRIVGLKGDTSSESSAYAANIAIKVINTKMGLNLVTKDIDVAHRLGQHKEGRNRPVIVKFVRREDKFATMRNAKKLKNTGIYINEDLTRLNAEVLASLRLKNKSRVERAWSFEGKLYALFQGKTKGEHVTFEQYQHWLDMPWPKKVDG